MFWAEESYVLETYLMEGFSVPGGSQWPQAAAKTRKTATGRLWAAVSKVTLPSTSWKDFLVGRWLRPLVRVTADVRRGGALLWTWGGNRKGGRRDKSLSSDVKWGRTEERKEKEKKEILKNFRASKFFLWVSRLLATWHFTSQGRSYKDMYPNQSWQRRRACVPCSPWVHIVFPSASLNDFFDQINWLPRNKGKHSGT